MWSSILEFIRQVFYIPFYNLLIFFAYLSGGSIGLAVVLVTLVIRIALLPQSLKAARSSTKLQQIQPEMNEIREKHKDDQKKMGEEMMKLYKRTGASPFGSCLPLLIQLPIIWILYRVLAIGLDTSRYDLLYSFTPRPEAINDMFFGINLAEPNLWVMPIIAGVLQLGLSYLTMALNKKSKKSQDPAAKMTQQIIYFFPIITVFIARSLPAALVLYWIVTTIFSIGQQLYINKTIKSEPTSSVKEIDTEKKKVKEVKEKAEPKKAGKKKSGRLDKYMTNKMKKKLDKEDRKKGVDVTIRKKD